MTTFFLTGFGRESEAGTAWVRWMACQSRQGALSTVIIGAEKIFGSGVEKPACGGDERAGFRRAMGDG